MPLLRSNPESLSAKEAEIVGFEAEGFGIRFCLLHLAAGEVRAEEAAHETGYLLSRGTAHVTAPGGLSARISRGSLFDDLPSTLHVPRGARVELSAIDDVELFRYEIDNPAQFPARLILPEAVRNERRGKGAHKDASFRFVRTILDDEAGPPEAQLVLGEVVNLPGRWSSYPPHHHAQPEIYHYRFTEPRGYGHAEEGDRVHKVYPGDTLLIPPGEDHSQCAPPGYGMWYAWAIRHLDGERYTVPEFTEAHRWTMDPNVEAWWPRGED